MRRAFHKFEPAIKRSLGARDEDIALYVTGGRLDDEDGVIAALQLWNGALKHQDKILVTREQDRKRFANEATRAEPKVPQAELKMALLELGGQVRQRLGEIQGEAGESPPGAADHSDPASTYCFTEQGIVWHRPTREGAIPTPLTNFAATITGDVAEDDGAEIRRQFEIEGKAGNRTMRFTVPAFAFPTMNWVTEHLGAGAVVYAGVGIKDHTRVAIQLLSGDAPQRHVYTHTGWRQTSDGEWIYLHAGGAIQPASR